MSSCTKSHGAEARPAQKRSHKGRQSQGTPGSSGSGNRQERFFPCSQGISTQTLDFMPPKQNIYNNRVVCVNVCLWVCVHMRVSACACVCV